MKVDGQHYRTIWKHEIGETVLIIDQTRLPHEFSILELQTVEAAARAIADMQVRGAPLIGATAAYGLCLAVQENSGMAHLEESAAALLKTRPTAVNLHWAVERMLAVLRPLPVEDRVKVAWAEAARIGDEDVAICAAIGNHGLSVIRTIFDKKKDIESDPPTINILTHCNAGWLATVDWGTALAPIYKAQDAGIPLHVWVDETRPRNQGASLTAWELQQHGVPHTLIVDNAGGHLMQQGMVDLCIVGTDRTAANGDVCNKIGTYLKALAAHDNGIPFYVALPSPTIDWTLEAGSAIPIEERGGEEVGRMRGRNDDGEIVEISIAPEGCRMSNYAFDVTPARLVTGLITEKGVCEASREGLQGLFAIKK